HNKEGFSLLELLLVLGIVSAMYGTHLF
ncbi:TPA: prepilin-type N-terminal cleavage/methylation domain-containing protein, partial [Klebsiella pneumoniae]|nr:prepilin-type N-terminal cleavage/methylation domain-containing protein [Klebsiella pneumoniae]